MGFKQREKSQVWILEMKFGGNVRCLRGEKKIVPNQYILVFMVSLSIDFEAFIWCWRVVRVDSGYEVENHWDETWSSGRLESDLKWWNFFPFRLSSVAGCWSVLLWVTEPSPLYINSEALWLRFPRYIEIVDMRHSKTFSLLMDIIEYDILRVQYLLCIKLSKSCWDCKSY